MTYETAKSPCVELRTAGASDFPAVLALLGRANLPTAGVAGAQSHFVMAESDGNLVGVVGLELYGGSALLRSAAVEERWRGSGVGRVLIERALDVARERGIEHAGVKSSVEFQEACPATATVMRKSLKETTL